MRAGKPQLVCPMLGDQADNAERLINLGVARRLDHKRFDAERARTVLAELLSDRDAARRAASLAPEVAREDGAAVAAQGIAELLRDRAAGQAA